MLSRPTDSLVVYDTVFGGETHVFLKLQLETSPVLSGSFPWTLCFSHLVSSGGLGDFHFCGNPRG